MKNTFCVVPLVATGPLREGSRSISAICNIFWIDVLILKKTQLIMWFLIQPLLLVKFSLNVKEMYTIFCYQT